MTATSAIQSDTMGSTTSQQVWSRQSISCCSGQATCCNTAASSAISMSLHFSAGIHSDVLQEVCLQPVLERAANAVCVNFDPSCELLRCSNQLCQSPWQPAGLPIINSIQSLLVLLSPSRFCLPPTAMSKHIIMFLMCLTATRCDGAGWQV